MRATFLRASSPAGALLFLLVPFVISLPLQDVHGHPTANWTEKWRFVSPESNFGVVTRDGTIYAATVPSILAFHSNGTLKWNLTIETSTSKYGITTGWNCDLLLGADGTMYASSTLPHSPTLPYNNSIYAVNPNGTVKWKATDLGKEKEWGRLSMGGTAINLEDSTLFVQSNTGYVTALSDGKQMWTRFVGIVPISRRTGEEPVLKPVFGQGLVYATTQETVWALKPNGDVKWRFHLNDTINKQFALNTVTLGPVDTVYIVVDVTSSNISCPGSENPVDHCESLHLYALSSDGMLKWDVDLGVLAIHGGERLNSFIPHEGGSVAVSRDGRLVFVPVYGPIGRGSIAEGGVQFLVAVAPNGTIQWSQPPSQTYFGPKMSPIVAPDGLVYISDSSSRLSALTADEGTVVWSYDANHPGVIAECDAVYPPVFTLDDSTMIVPTFDVEQMVVLQSI
jgi:outer membrane protein assembly factor BamB